MIWSINSASSKLENNGPQIWKRSFWIHFQTGFAGTWVVGGSVRTHVFAPRLCKRRERSRCSLKRLTLELSPGNDSSAVYLPFISLPHLLIFSLMGFRGHLLGLHLWIKGDSRKWRSRRFTTNHSAVNWRGGYFSSFSPTCASSFNLCLGQTRPDFNAV